ncbi:MAG: hypothetical protein ABIG70_04900 [Pseudomonadota bacterium]
MTENIDLDAMRQKQSTQPMLPFDGGDLDRSGIRLTRAEFARFLEVSKQAVTDWVKSGKVTLGADGRLDPRQAVSQLLRNTDPARLRSKVLAPLVRDVGAYQQRIADLEKALAIESEAVAFAEDGVNELHLVLECLDLRLTLEWNRLRAHDSDVALAAISAWIQNSVKFGGKFEAEIISDAADSAWPEPPGLAAPVNHEEGEGETDTGDLVAEFCRKLG